MPVLSSGGGGALSSNEYGSFAARTVVDVVDGANVVDVAVAGERRGAALLACG